MLKKSALSILLCATFAFGDGATTQPTTKPTTQPTTRAASTQTIQAPIRVAYFDLSAPIAEKPADFTLFGKESTTLRTILERISMAGSDSSIRGILVTLGDTGFNLSQAQELRDALAMARKNGKEIFVYADSYDTATYTLASAANHICMLEGGQIMMPGVALETTFAKGLLDKIGVQADYIQIGEYKGADEQFTRTEPSQQLRGELNKLIEALYAQVVAGISLNRNLSKEDVEAAIDQAILSARAAKDRGLIDELIDMDSLREFMANELGRKVVLLPDYGKPPKESLDFSNPFALMTMLTKRPIPSGKPAIALIHASGMIIDGEGGTTIFGGNVVGSEDLRKAFRLASRDESVKAIVLRIDSPGGSAVASEAMWQAARRAGATKPLIVSIGGMAASGGYYLASCSDTIYADPTAIVGSIGVVGGKFVLKDLFAKVGITTEKFQKGRNADLFSSTEPFNDRQRKMVTGWMKQTYDLFTDRVMITRKGKIADIDQVARGRIFLASEARKLGMVDELGGMDAAITTAASRASLLPGTYEVRSVPAPKTLLDLLTTGGSDTAMPFQPKVQIAPDSMLNLLPASAKASIGQTMQSLMLLQERPVQLVSPYIVTVK